MGAKYLPTIKDQKLNQRYHTKNNPLAVFRKGTVVPALPVGPKTGTETASRPSKSS